MQLYSHTVDLRIWHPKLDPDVVSATLGLVAQVAWRDGEVRKTPKGTVLEGVRSGGYWSANPFSYGWQSSTDALLEDTLEELLTFLEPHTSFLHELSREGEVRIWASTHGDRNFALELFPRMLNRIASLGARFVHDVYQGP